MPDFSAYFSTVLALEPWLDPALPSVPSRVHTITGHDHQRRQSAVGQDVEIIAVVDGAPAPLDGALSGRLFVGWLAESPGTPPVVTTPAGQSSVRRFTPTTAGHFTYVLHRAGGGGVVLHLDVI